MKFSLKIALCVSLVAMGSMKADDSLSTYVKIGFGVGITAGFGYALWRIYQDAADQKRYAQSPKRRLMSDAFTVIGLGYLTYQSGLYTLEAMKDLAEKKEGDEKDKQA